MSLAIPRHMPRTHSFASPSADNADRAESVGRLPAGKVGLTQRFARSQTPVQRKASAERDPHTGLGAEEIADHAARGVSGAGQALPHFDVIQRAFGPHDLSGVRAHIGGAAAESADHLGAHAYATGNHVAFAREPDLFLAAHEAAHVVQQRHGVALKGAVGQDGDAYERHADEVAAAVVRGDDASALLGVPSAGAAGYVQRKGKAAAPTPKVTATTNLGKKGGPKKPIVLDGAGEDELEIELRWQGNADAASANGAPVLYDGHKKGLVVTSTQIDKKESMKWTLKVTRPLTGAFKLYVSPDGETASEIVIELQRILPKADIERSLRRVEDRAKMIDEEVESWLADTSVLYNSAHKRVKDALDEDQKTADFWTDLLFSAATTAIGGIAGPVAKHFFSYANPGTLGQKVVDELIGDGAKAIAPIVTSGIKTTLDSVPEATDPFERFITLKASFAKSSAKRNKELRATLARIAEYDTLDFDPLIEVERAINSLGLPWARGSVEAFEREIWVRWVEAVGGIDPKGEALESWHGRDYSKAIARLTKLGIYHADPDPAPFGILEKERKAAIATVGSAVVRGIEEQTADELKTRRAEFGDW